MNPPVTLPANFSPIAVEKIEGELSARWHRTNGDGSRQVTHACTLNLVACVESVESSSAVSEDVGAIAATHPIRAISVIPDEAHAETSVRAWVGVDCSDREGAQIYSEEICLLVHPEAVDLVASTIEGLLAADLPVHLWWRGGTPWGVPLFSGLARVADKIIVDSVLFGDGAAALDTVRRLLDLRGGRAGVTDLNWIRTAPWREAIAACFDDPGVLGLLPALTRASVSYASDDTHGHRPTARALLVAAWLANRLPRLRGRIRIKPDSERNVAPGRVVKVSLSSPEGRVALELTRQPAGISATATNEADERIRDWIFPAATLGEAELLHRCIDAPPRDPLLEAALRSE